MSLIELRSGLRTCALAGAFGCASLVFFAQLGCGGATHEPPKVSEAELEAHAQDQLKIREQEMSGGKP